MLVRSARTSGVANPSPRDVEKRLWHESSDGTTKRSPTLCRRLHRRASSRRERIAPPHVARVEAGAEPAGALLGGAVGPGLGVHLAGGLLLNPVVAHGGGGAQAVVEVPRIEDVALLGRIAPDARQAVGLKLQLHRQRVGAARVLLLQTFDLVADPQQLLHVMAELVGDDVGLRELARRAEAVAQLAVEAEVDVDLLIGRTVEGAHGGLGKAAAGAYGVGEEDEPGVPVGLSRFREDLGPGLLVVVEDEGDELDELVLLGRGRSRRGLGRRTARRASAADQREEILLEDEAQQQQHQEAADPQLREGSPTAAGAPPIVLQIRARSTWRPSHASPLSRFGDLSRRLAASPGRRLFAHLVP